MNELVGMSIGPQDNIAATAAVTAIRSSFGNEFLAPKTDTPASAPSGLRENFDTIDKHGAGTCHSTRPLSSHLPCHPERSEGPSQLLHDQTFKKARDQMRGSSPSNLVAVYPVNPFYR